MRVAHLVELRKESLAWPAPKELWLSLGSQLGWEGEGELEQPSMGQLLFQRSGASNASPSPHSPLIYFYSKWEDAKVRTRADFPLLTPQANSRSSRWKTQGSLAASSETSSLSASVS